MLWIRWDPALYPNDDDPEAWMWVDCLKKWHGVDRQDGWMILSDAEVREYQEEVAAGAESESEGESEGEEFEVESEQEGKEEESSDSDSDSDASVSDDALAGGKRKEVPSPARPRRC